MKDIIESNYDSIVKRGLITPQTKQKEFELKLAEELIEVCKTQNIKDLAEEIADLILTALNYAKHNHIDIEQELKNKIQKNYERAKS